MKQLLVLSLLIALSACVQPQVKQNVTCSHEKASDFRLNLFHAASVKDQVFQDAANSIPPIENFLKADNSNMTIHEHIIGLTQSESRKGEILNEVKKHLKPEWGLTPVWTKNKGSRAFGSDTAYELQLIQSNDFNISISCENIKMVDLVENHGGIALAFTVDEATNKKFTKMTEDAFNRGRRSIAFIFNNEIYTCPMVAGPITGDTFQMPVSSMEEGEFIASLLL